MPRPIVALACAAAAVVLAAVPTALAQDRGPADPVSMERWARDLDTDDPARALDACRRFDNTGPEAIPVLIGVLRTGTDRGAAIACTLLSSRGKDATAAAAVIEEEIAKRDDRFLRAAARTLWKIEARTTGSLPSLRTLAQQEEAAGTALVWRLTGEEGKLRSILERDAASENVPRRSFVADVLVEFGPTAGKELSLRLALQLAKDEFEWTRKQALCVLTAVAPASPESIAEYERAVKESSVLLRFEGIRGLAAAGLSTPGVLAAIGRSGYFRGGRLPIWAVDALLRGTGWTREELAARLVPLIANEDVPTRVGAALVASSFGPGTSEMARALADGLVVAELRSACLSALTILGAPTATVATDVGRLLSDADAGAAMGAADLLLALGKPGVAAAPAVADALLDSRPRLRQAAANLLLTVYGVASVPDLDARLKGVDPAKNPEAAKVLRKVRGLPDDAPPILKKGAPSKQSIERLVKELREVPVGERQLVLRRIAEVGPEAAAALPAILEILDDPKDSTSRGDAMIALAAVAPTDPKTPQRIGPYLVGSNARLKSKVVQALVSLGPHQPRVAVAYLVDALERDADTRLEAAMALARIGAASVDPLRGRLGHADAAVRLWCIRALGEIGPAAKEAIPALETAATGDADAGVRDAAAKAIKRIRGS